jgi:hypothetical protein
MGFIDMFDASGAASDEDQPIGVDQHHADTRPVGQIFITRHSVNASSGHPGKGRPNRGCNSPLSSDGEQLARF